jgi:hypothetical protein
MPACRLCTRASVQPCVRAAVSPCLRASVHPRVHWGGGGGGRGGGSPPHLRNAATARRQCNRPFVHPCVCAAVSLCLRAPMPACVCASARPYSRVRLCVCAATHPCICASVHTSIHAALSLCTLCVSTCTSRYMFNNFINTFNIDIQYKTLWKNLL